MTVFLWGAAMGESLSGNDGAAPVFFTFGILFFGFSDRRGKA